MSKKCEMIRVIQLNTVSLIKMKKFKFKHIIEIPVSLFWVIFLFSKLKVVKV